MLRRVDMPIEDDYRNTIGADITRLTASALESGAITLEQGQQIAQLVLSDIDKPQTKEEMTAFLQNLAQQWSIFEPLVHTDEAYKSEENKQQNLEEITSLIKENKIDEALNKTQQLSDLAPEGGTTDGS